MRRSCLPFLLVVALVSPARADRIAEARERFRAAEAFKADGRFDEAIVAYQQAYDLAASPELFFNVALCYKLKGERQRALEVFRTYLEMNPNGPGAPRAAELIATLERELLAAPERPQLPVPSPLLPPQPAPARPAPRAGRALRIAGVAGLAAGGVALVAGAYYQARAAHVRDELAGLTTWDPGLYADGRAAQRNGLILLGAGATFAAAGGVLLVLGLRTGVSVEPGRAVVTVSGKM